MSQKFGLQKMYLICRGLRGLAPRPAGPLPRQGFQAPPPAGPSPRQTFQAPLPAGLSIRIRLQATPPTGPDPAGARPRRGRGLAGAYPGHRRILCFAFYLILFIFSSLLFFYECRDPPLSIKSLRKDIFCTIIGISHLM